MWRLLLCAALCLALQPPADYEPCRWLEMHLDDDAYAVTLTCDDEMPYNQLLSCYSGGHAAPQPPAAASLRSSANEADADGKRAQEFDLEAFQDLLMLHGVARRVCGSTDSNLQPFSTARVIPLPPTVTIAAPLEANAMAEMIGSDMDMPAIDAHSLAELDLDLSEPEGNLIDFDGIGFPPDSRSTP